MSSETLAKNAHDLKSICDFKNFMRTSVFSAFNHEMAVCGIGDLKSRRVIRLININFPARYLNYAVQPNQAIQSPLVHRWIEKQQPIIFHADGPSVDIDTNWLNVVRSCKIQTLATHGVVDPCNQCFSYFGFGNVDVSTNNDIETKLIELTPILHYALSRVLTLKNYTTTVNDFSENAIPYENVSLFEKIENPTMVTPREKEIVNWIALGKRNNDIAQILGISQNTVNNHIKSLFKRLDVTSRAQAVSKAASLNIIQNHQK